MAGAMAMTSMTLGRAIFCEQRGAWAVALRSLLMVRGIELRETRSLVECDEVLCETPGSLLVLELTAANVDRLLERLTVLPQRDRQARAVVVAQRGLSQYHGLVLELGTLAFETSPRRAKLLAELAERFFAQRTVEELPLPERVWAELPWRDVARSRGGSAKFKKPMTN